MKRFVLFSASCVWLLFSSSTFPSTIGFGSGTLHVRPAYSAPRSCFFIGTHTRAFFKDEVRKEPSGLSVGETFWDIQGGLGMFYGVTSKLELGFSQIYYQDNHKAGTGYNLPDDLFLHLKLGSLGRNLGNTRYGLQMDVRLPTAKYHNLPLEDYSAGRIAIGFMALASIITEPLFPETGMNIHFNLGLFTHNDVAAHLVDHPQDTLVVKSNTQELLFGSAFSTTWQDFGFFMELYGRTFLTKPPLNAYTRESSLYFTPGMTYAPNRWMKLRVAMDLRVLGAADETRYAGDQGSYAETPWSHPLNLPQWRISLGALISLNPKKFQMVRKKENAIKRATVIETATPDEKVYDDLAGERKKTENAEVELERIRKERQRMEDLLDRLRKILETPGETKSENPPSPEK
jgi:hypothetical protein